MKKFIAALDAAGASHSISATYRPPERAYLMHWSWMIAKKNYNAQSVPAKAGVNINWWHGDAQKSKKAAQDMVDGYGTGGPKIKVAPSLTSRHIQKKAIDMGVSWSGTLKIKDAGGKEKTITSKPCDSTNADLIAVGKTYGVVHFQPASSDRPHWSTDGH